MSDDKDVNPMLSISEISLQEQAKVTPQEGNANGVAAPSELAGLQVADTLTPSENKFIREESHLVEITHFTEINDQELDTLSRSLLGQVISEYNYNSFIFVHLLMLQYAQGKSINPNYSILQALHEVRFPIEMDKTGGNCVSSARLLQSRLQEKGITSHIVRFKATNLIRPSVKDSAEEKSLLKEANDEAISYVKHGHAALVVPMRNEAGEEQFMLLDPGLVNPEPIIFSKDKPSQLIVTTKGTSYRIVPNQGSDSQEFSHILIKGEKNGDQEYIPFDPLQSWLNPETTIQNDILRGLCKFIIIGNNSDGRLLAGIFIDLRRRKIEGKMNDKMRKKYNIGHEGVILDLGQLPQIPSEDQRQFFAIAEYLKLNPQQLMESLIMLSKCSDEYMEKILAPSVSAVLLRGNVGNAN